MIVQAGLQTQAPIAAFRYFAWRKGELCSVADWHNRHQAWPVGGVVDARCDVTRKGAVPHLAPFHGCTCGVYAVDSLATLRARRRHLVGPWPWSGRRIVTCVVQLWGGTGRGVLVGKLKRANGLQIRAPHGSVLCVVDQEPICAACGGSGSREEKPCRACRGRLARRVGRKLGLRVVPAVHAEAFAREHGGVQLRPADQASAGTRTRMPSDAKRRFARAAGRALRGLLVDRRTHLALAVGALALLLRAFPAAGLLLLGVIVAGFAAIAILRAYAGLIAVVGVLLAIGWLVSR